MMAWSLKHGAKFVVMCVLITQLNALTTSTEEPTTSVTTTGPAETPTTPTTTTEAPTTQPSQSTRTPMVTSSSPQTAGTSSSTAEQTTSPGTEPSSSPTITTTPSPPPVTSSTTVGPYELTSTDKIIIGVTCATAGLVIIGAIVYGVTKRKQMKKQEDEEHRKYLTSDNIGGNMGSALQTTNLDDVPMNTRENTGGVSSFSSPAQPIRVQSPVTPSQAYDNNAYDYSEKL